MSRTYRQGLTWQRLTDEDFRIFVYKWPGRWCYSKYRNRMRPFKLPIKIRYTWPYKANSRGQRKTERQYTKNQIRYEFQERYSSDEFRLYETSIEIMQSEGKYDSRRKAAQLGYPNR